MAKREPNRVVIEWKTTSGFGAPHDGEWTEFCTVETDQKPYKAGTAGIIVAALNARKEKPAFDYRVKPTKAKKGK